MDMGKSDGPNKTMKVVLYFLIVAVTAFLVVALFKKQMAGDKEPANQVQNKSGAVDEKEKKKLEERIELAKKGFSDALDGEISAVGADKKTIKVKPDESEQLDENKIIDVVINDKTEIIKSSIEIKTASNTTGDRDDEEAQSTGKTEKVGLDTLQAGMLVQVQTAEMLEFKNLNSITAVKVVIVDRSQEQ